MPHMCKFIAPSATGPGVAVSCTCKKALKKLPMVNWENRTSFKMFTSQADDQKQEVTKRQFDAWMSQVYAKSGNAGQYKSSKMQSFALCYEHFPEGSFYRNTTNLIFGALPTARSADRRPTALPTPTRRSDRIAGTSPRPPGRPPPRTPARPAEPPTDPASLTKGSGKKKASPKRRTWPAGRVGDGEPPPLVDLDRLEHADPKGLKSLLGFTTWPVLVALYELLDFSGDLSEGNITYYNWGRTSSWRFKEGALGGGEQPAPVKKRRRGHSASKGRDASATTSLDQSFIPQPTGAKKPVHKLGEHEAKRVNASRTGAAHKYGSFRCFIFTLMALFSGVTMRVAAMLMCIDYQRVPAILSTYVMLIYWSLRREQPSISSARSQCRFPKHWEEVLKTNKVKLVIDATELPCQSSSVLSIARCFYSKYKKGHTVKFLVGVTAHGTIVFVSEGYPGKISDFEITELCGVLDLLEPGDLLLADRGFNVVDLAAKKACGVLVGKTHARGEKDKMAGKYTTDQLLQMERYSNVRIHVERAMRSIKRMRFLGTVIRHDCKHLIGPIVGVAAMLSNYGMPLMNREDAERVVTVD